MSILLFISKIIFSAIEFFGVVILSLSIFRVPYKFAFYKTIIISAIMGIIEVYFREIVGNDYALLPVVIAEILMVMIIFQLPILYSLLICIVGYICAFIIEISFILLGSLMGITTQELVANSIVHLFTLEIAVAVFLVFVSWFLQNRKLGFQFIAKHLSLKTSLKGYNFLLSALLLLGVIVMQLQLRTVIEHDIKMYVQFLLTFIFLIAIVVAFIYNKKQIKQKYERLTKK